MPEYTIETAIAVGWNNAAGLALITSLSASSIPFIGVYTPAQYDRGLKRPKANGLTGFAGRPAKVWVSGLLWLPQWDYLVATYEGKVTIRTWTSSTTYGNFNAILKVPETSEFEPDNETKYGHALKDFTWQFSIVGAL